MLRARLTLALALACAAPAAQATPPDLVQIHDQLLAVSAESLFLLRTSNDNLGLYDAEIRTIALIELDRDTGTETVWPVYAARHYRDPDNSKAPHFQLIQPLDLPGSTNPFKRLQDQNAQPTLPFETDTPPVRIDTPPVRIDTSDGQLIIRGDDGTSVQADLVTLVRTAGRNLGAYGARIDYRRFGVLSFAQLLEDTALSYDRCHPVEARQIRDMTAPVPPTILRLDCGDAEGDDLIQASLILLIPPAAP